MLCVKYLHRHPSEFPAGTSSRILVDLGIVLLTDNEAMERARGEAEKEAARRGRRQR